MRRFSCLVCAALLALVATVGCGTNYDLRKSEGQMRVGVDAAKENLWREALFRFKRAVDLDPNNAMAHNNLAVAYEGIGEFEKARSEYTAALKIEKANPYIQKNYSRFVEFYTRNLKRERKLEPGAPATATTTAKPAETTPAAATPATPPAENPQPTPAVTQGTGEENPAPTPTQEAPAATPGTAPANPQPEPPEPPAGNPPPETPPAEVTPTPPPPPPPSGGAL